MTAQSKTWVCYRFLAGIAGCSNPTVGHGCLFVLSAVCYQVEVSATGLSLLQKSLTECGVLDCHLGTSKRKRPRSTRTAEP